MTNNRDLDDLTQRADRMLDGMSANKEKFAREVKQLTSEVRNWRAAFDRMKTEGPKVGGFADVFGDLFGGARK